MKALRLTIGIIFLIPVFIVFGLLALIIGNLLSLFHLEKASEKCVHFLLGILIRWIFICFGVKLHVEGKENIPAWGSHVCYIANHQSALDIPVLFGSGAWCGIVAKKELYKIPFLHSLLNLLRCIPLDRSSLRAGLQSILTGVERIKSGYPMGIFPEGTRSKTGEIAEMKAGAFKMATKAKALLVPVAMKNTRTAFEAADSLKRVHVYVKIMKPIDTSLLSEEEVKNIHTVAENMVREAYAVLPGPYAKG